MKGMGKRALGRTDQETAKTHLLCARVGFWKANTRAYSRGRFSLGSHGLVRQLLRPRNLPKRVRAGMSDGVSICMSAKHSLTPFPQRICLSVQIAKHDVASLLYRWHARQAHERVQAKYDSLTAKNAHLWNTPGLSPSVES